MIPLTEYAAADRAAELARQRLDATHTLPGRTAKRRHRMPRLVIAVVIAMGAVGPLTP